MNYQATRHGMETIPTEPGNGGAEAERIRLRMAGWDADRNEYLAKHAYDKPKRGPSESPKCPVHKTHMRRRKDGTYPTRCWRCLRGEMEPKRSKVS